MRILLTQLNPTIGALEANVDKIIAALDEARARSCSLVLFSELAICGYPPEDLLLLPSFVDGCEHQLQRIIAASADLAVVVGTIRRSKGEKPLHNTAAVIEDGRLLGFEDKTLLPTYDVFFEHRYFEPAGEPKIWELAGESVAITICEDIWKKKDRAVLSDYLRDPVLERKKFNPTILLNLSASPYSYKGWKRRSIVLSRASKELKIPSIYCNQVGANDSLIFDGGSLVTDAGGNIAFQAKFFAEEFVAIDTENLQPISLKKRDHLGDLFNALVLGVRDYFQKSGFFRALIGLSGGIDSALVVAIAVHALGSRNVQTVGMPSRYSSKSSLSDAEHLAANFEVDYKVISIDPLFQNFLDLLEPHFDNRPPDATEENLQARIRGMILMALSNKHGHIVLSTGNKSEMAMGYATLYGDMCGGLSVIGDVSKIQVYELCHWLNREREVIPKNILEKPPSAELRPDQKDSDTLPDYHTVDAVLESYVEKHHTAQVIATEHGIPLPLVEDLIRRIHRNEYKRRQAPPGLRVTERAFSVGRRFPIVHH